MKLFGKLVILYFLLNSPFTIYSQITITEIEKYEEKEVLRPEPYDSLKNLEVKKLAREYKQYIGLQIYLPPLSNPEMDEWTGKTYHTYMTKEPVIVPVATSQKLADYHYSELKKIYDSILTYTYKPFHYYSRHSNSDAEANITSDMNLIGNKYYTIIDVIYGDSLINHWNALSKRISEARDKKSNTYVAGINSYGGYGRPDVLFVIKDEYENIIYCRSITQFILVPYFEKQKNIYENKTLLYDDEMTSYGTFKNITRKENDTRIIVKYEDDYGKEKTKGKEVLVAPGSKWKCKNVTLLKPSYEMYYILDNDQNEQIALKNLNGYIEENDYLKREQDKKLQEHQLLAKLEQEKILNEKLANDAFLKYREECIKLFGQQNGELIASGKVKIGMNKEMCMKAWGIPYWTDKVTSNYSITEDWYYGFGYSLHFEDGILKVIDE
jgi:hypothetical protein